YFFFSSRRRHTRSKRDWSSDVCSSDLGLMDALVAALVSLMIVFVGNWLGKRESNLLIYNLILAFLAEVVIIGMDFLGIGTHQDRSEERRVGKEDKGRRTGT